MEDKGKIPVWRPSLDTWNEVVAPRRRADRAKSLRWWVWAVLAAVFLLGVLFGAVVW